MKTIVWMDDDIAYLACISNCQKPIYRVTTFQDCSALEQWLLKRGSELITKGEIAAIFLDFFINSNDAYGENTTSFDFDIPRLLRDVLSYSGPIFVVSGYDLSNEKEYIEKYNLKYIEKNTFTHKDINNMVSSFERNL